MRVAGSFGVSRGQRIGVVAGLLFVFAFLYRFNTLGGAFGGFDNDHFLQFAYAKQVEAGEQPLRDFFPLGLQGARPSLTYELSAATQSLFGDNLRTEALLTAFGVAIATVVTFVAAARVAPIGWALAMSALSLFLAPKLYAYPKVLTFAFAALLLGRYVRRPGIGRAIACALFTAVAFLFRHDYAVYAAVGFIVAAALAAGDARHAGRHVFAWGVATVLLLTPSLVLIQRDAGLLNYLRDSRDLSRREAARTDLPWPIFEASGEAASGAVVHLLDSEHNGAAALYYVVRVLPLAALVVLWPDLRRREPAAVTVAAVAAIALVANPFLLRGNVAARLGDVGPLFAVTGAAVADASSRWTGRQAPPTRVLAAVLLLFLLVVTVRATWSVGTVAHELDTAGLSESAAAVAKQARRRWRELGSLPAAYWVSAPGNASLAVSRYLHECTSAGDRILLMTYAPELLPLAGRLFAAGRGNFIGGMLIRPEHERLTLLRWKSQAVPLALVEDAAAYAAEYPHEFPNLDRYLQERYRFAGSVQIDGSRVLRVFADRTRVPVRAYGATGLPCFE